MLLSDNFHWPYHSLLIPRHRGLYLRGGEDFLDRGDSHCSFHQPVAKKRAHPVLAGNFADRPCSDLLKQKPADIVVHDEEFMDTGPALVPGAAAHVAAAAVVELGGGNINTELLVVVNKLRFQSSLFLAFRADTAHKALREDAFDRRRYKERGDIHFMQ